MIRYEELAPGMTAARIECGSVRALISLYGGQVLSWTPGCTTDVLFVSRASSYSVGKAIRGGIPVCFPWFGPHPMDPGLPAHGFARVLPWRLAFTREDAEAVSIGMELGDTEYTRMLWPHSFTLTLEVRVGATLELAVKTRNTGDTPFEATDALHTYFAVSDIDTAVLEGFDGTGYIDLCDADAERTQLGSVVFEEEVDRVYRSAREFIVDDGGNGRQIIVRKKNFPETVVWNPWVERARRMADLEDGEYRRFLCAEAAAVLEERVDLAPGEEFEQRLFIERV